MALSDLLRHDTSCASSSPITGTLGLGKEPDADEPSSPKKAKRKPAGRHDLVALPSTPVLEQLVAAGKPMRHGVEETVSL